MESIKRNIVLNLKNIPGWRTSRKIVIIECDDWGGIRMPSLNVYKKLEKRGMKVATSRFNKYDTLETKCDLENLFETLCSVKDKNLRSAVITSFTNVANPDFEKIQACNFSEYYFEPFTDTLNRYYPDTDVMNILNQGMTEGIFIPELHGRDHIAVQFWMDKLREGDKDLLFSFDNGFVSIDIPNIPAPVNEFRAEFFFNSENQKPFLVNAIKDSVYLFKELFGYMPRVFVPGNGIFHSEFDKIVAKAGVKYMNVSNKMPYPDTRGDLKYRYFITGQKGPEGLTYYTRNCSFEPSAYDYYGIEVTMRQIETAFRWGKPASISTHRVNFAGGIEPSNREKGLRELHRLLNAIVHKWPDIEFMSSGDALDFMCSKRIRFS